MERERRRNGDRGNEDGKNGNENGNGRNRKKGDGGTGTGSKVHHDKKRIKLKEQHNNKQNNFRTHSIISGIKRSFFHQLNKTKI